MWIIQLFYLNKLALEHFFCIQFFLPTKSMYARARPKHPPFMWLLYLIVQSFFSMRILCKYAFYSLSVRLLSLWIRFFSHYICVNESKKLQLRLNFSGILYLLIFVWRARIKALASNLNSSNGCIKYSLDQWSS